MATFFTAALAASVLLVAVHPGAVNACSADDCVAQAFASIEACDSCIDCGQRQFTIVGDYLCDVGGSRIGGAVESPRAGEMEIRGAS